MGTSQWPVPTNDKSCSGQAPHWKLQALSLSTFLQGPLKLALALQPRSQGGKGYWLPAVAPCSFLRPLLHAARERT